MILNIKDNSKSLIAKIKEKMELLLSDKTFMKLEKEVKKIKLIILIVATSSEELEIRT